MVCPFVNMFWVNSWFFSNYKYFQKQSNHIFSKKFKSIGRERNTLEYFSPSLKNLLCRLQQFPIVSRTISKFWPSTSLKKLLSSFHILLANSMGGASKHFLVVWEACAEKSLRAANSKSDATTPLLSSEARSAHNIRWWADPAMYIWTLHMEVRLHIWSCNCTIPSAKYI